jgi:hypothetical protein
MYEGYDQSKHNYLKGKEIQAFLDILQILEEVEYLAHFFRDTE